MVAPAACREEMGTIPLMPDIQMVRWGNLPTWTAVTIQPNLDAIEMDTGGNHSTQWAKLRAVWLVIDHSLLLAVTFLH